MGIRTRLLERVSSVAVMEPLGDFTALSRLKATEHAGISSTYVPYVVPVVRPIFRAFAKTDATTRAAEGS